MGNQGLSSRNSTWPMNMSSRHNNNDQNAEKVEGELKKKLLELDLYDQGMSVEDMKKRIWFIDESKNEASFSSTNNSASAPDVIEAVQSLTTSPVDNHVMSNLSSKATGRESMSPDAVIGSYQQKWPSHKENDSQDELIFGSRSADANLVDAVRARKVMDESSNSRYQLSPSPISDTNTITRRNHSSQDIKSYHNTHRSSKLIDNFDVFACKVLPNDVPLMPRCPHKPQQRIRIVDGTPVIPDDISAQKLAYLTEMANLAHSWKAKLVCDEFSWGPPIKVGIANGSLDKHPIQDDLPDGAESLGQSCPITKGTNTTDYTLRPRVESKNVFEFTDSDDEFVETSKRKKTPKILSNRTEVPQLQLKKSVDRVALKDTSPESLSPCDMLDIEVEKANNTINGRKRIKSSSPEYPEYRRRVIPPIPSTTGKSKKKSAIPTIRPKKKNTSIEPNIKEPIPKKSTSSLSEKEIADLISDDEEPKIVDCVLPPTKRLNQGVEYLKKAQQAEENEKKKRENEAKLVAEQEAREKDERIQRRINERNERKQQQEAREKSEKEKEERYRRLTMSTRSQGHKSGTYQKRTELESDELRPRKLQLPPESMDIDDTDMFPDEEYEIKAVEAVEQPTCPICGKYFSQDEIENHAANCDDFTQDEAKDAPHVNTTRSGSNSHPPATFTCEICRFVTRNENFFKEHFSHCIKSLTDEGPRKIKASSRSPRSKVVLSTQYSDEEIDQVKSIPSPSTTGKRRPKPSSRKRKL